MPIALVLLAAIAVALAWGWLEAGRLRTRVLEVALPDLPATLDGLRIGHLSDLHLGAPLSRGHLASRRAVEWISARKPDFVCITGDLVSHPRGEATLVGLLDVLDRPLVVLGNHDVAVTRDPFSRAAELRDLEGVRLLRDEALTLPARAARISFVGIDPTRARGGPPSLDELAGPDFDPANIDPRVRE